MMTSACSLLSRYIQSSLGCPVPVAGRCVHRIQRRTPAPGPEIDIRECHLAIETKTRPWGRPGKLRLTMAGNDGWVSQMPYSGAWLTQLPLPRSTRTGTPTDSSMRHGVNVKGMSI